jgi:nucleolin
MNNTKFDGVFIKVEYSKRGAQKNVTQKSYQEKKVTQKSDQKKVIYKPSKTLVIKNLSFDTTQITLHNIFSQFGDITSIRVVFDKDTQRSKGFAFVEFTELDTAQKVMENPPSTIEKRNVFIDFAPPKK